MESVLSSARKSDSRNGKKPRLNPPCCAYCNSDSNSGFIVCVSCNQLFHYECGFDEKKKIHLQDPEHSIQDNMCQQCRASKASAAIPILYEAIDTPSHFEYRQIFQKVEGGRYSLVQLLLYLEWVISTDVIVRIAKLVANYFSHIASLDAKPAEYLTAKVIRSSLQWNAMMSGIRDLVGHDKFDEIDNHLKDGHLTLAIGMAPSFALFSSRCPSCQAWRYLHSFCYNCALMFSTKKEKVASTVEISTKKDVVDGDEEWMVFSTAPLKTPNNSVNRKCCGPIRTDGPVAEEADFVQPLLKLQRFKLRYCEPLALKGIIYFCDNVTG